jgi:hypothetical protein
MHDAWTWLVSDRSLPYRIAVGVSIFATLAIVDLRRNGSRATRWCEYAFLLACVLLAMTYGIVNDLITSRISPEYFLYFKGALDRVSNDAAMNPEAHRGELDMQAVRIGALATWTAGLVAGAFVLVANSFGGWPRLSMRRLAWFVPPIFIAAIVGAIALGVLGGKGGLIGMGDFREMVARDEFRPFRLMCVYGIHLGGYVGWLLGLIAAILMTLQARRERAGGRQSSAASPVPSVPAEASRE